MIRKNKMETMPMGKLITNMSIPMMLSLLIQSLYNIIDSLFVAKLGEKAIAATSFAYPIQLLMIAVGVGTAVGLNAILSKTLGEKRYEEASEIATTGVALAIICSLLFAMLGLGGAKIIAHTLAKDDEIAEMCQSYLFICMLFCSGNLVSMMYQRLMQATGKTLLSMVILISGAITNIILDPILIFGLCGCTALGIRGAAIATIIGQWISMFIGIVLQNAYNQEIKINLKRFHIKKEYVKCIYRVGFPTIVTQALQSMMVTGINIILQPFSASAVAFFGVYYKLQMFLFMPMNGLGQAAIAIIAFNYGAGNKKRIREVVRILYPVAGFIALCGAILFFTIPDKLLGLFSASDMMLIVGIPAIRVLAPTFLLASTTLISGYISSGFQDGITNMLGAIIRQFIPLLPSAWLFAACFGVNRVWYAFWISELCSFIFSILRIRKHITALKIDNSSSL